MGHILEYLQCLLRMSATFSSPGIWPNLIRPAAMASRTVGRGCPSPEVVAAPGVVVGVGDFFMEGRNPRALPFFFFFVMTKKWRDKTKGVWKLLSFDL